VAEAEKAMQEKRYTAALSEWKLLASANNAEAQFQLGVMYGAGLGVDTDINVAVSWYQKAARQNHAEAAYVMCIAYAKGQGVKVDRELSDQWLRKAADLGSTNAQNGLGSIHYRKQEFADALVWYRKAAAKKDPDAQFNIGNIYNRGKGVEINEQEAIKWFTLAAEQNDDRAQNELGGIYMNRKDFKQGLAWLNKAAEAGNSFAQSDLGRAHFLGAGVAENKIEGFKWVFIATEISHSDYDRDLRDAMVAEMNAAQLEEGKNRAIKWLQEHGLVL
jgi:TPR repeat protein